MPGPLPGPTGVPGTGQATTIVTGPTNVYDIAQDDTYLYYTIHVPNNGSVVAVPKSSMGDVAPIVLASGGTANTPWGVTCDPGTTGYVYYTDFLATPQGKVYRVPKPVNGAAAGAAEVLMTGLNLPTFIRFNDVVGGDGLLYTCENVASNGRILRLTKTGLSQDPTASTFINMGTNIQPAYNLHLFSVNGTAQLWFTQMATDLSTGAQGQVRFINTSTTGPVALTSTTLVGTGLLNPSDCWLHQTSATATDVIWTEYDQSNGGARSASINSTSVRGTSIGQAQGSISFVPPASVKVNQASHQAFLTRNAQQVNGGGIYIVNLTSDLATEITVSASGGGVTGGVNYPFQFVGDATYGLFATEFNYTTGDTGSTNPSNIVRLGFPMTFSKTGASLPEENFSFVNQ